MFTARPGLILASTEQQSGDRESSTPECALRALTAAKESSEPAGGRQEGSGGRKRRSKAQLAGAAEGQLGPAGVTGQGCSPSAEGSCAPFATASGFRIFLPPGSVFPWRSCAVLWEGAAVLAPFLSSSLEC